MFKDKKVQTKGNIMNEKYIIRRLKVTLIMVTFFLTWLIGSIKLNNQIKEDIILIDTITILNKKCYIVEKNNETFILTPSEIEK